MGNYQLSMDSLQQRQLDKIEEKLDKDHDVLILVADRVNATSDLQQELVREFKQVHVELRLKASKADLDAVKKRVKNLEKTHQTETDRKEGVKHFFGIAWNAWGVITGIILFLVAIFNVASNQ